MRERVALSDGGDGPAGHDPPPAPPRHSLALDDTNQGEDGDRRGDGMPDEPGDGELLAAADQDPGAFRALYDRWAGRPLAYCHRRTGDAEVALGLVAETFAIAYERRASFRGDGPV